MTVALALPSVASAQDPSVDQYTPTAPGGGGSEPVAPVPSVDGNGGGAPPADTGSGGDSGATSPSDSGEAVPSGSETSPVEPVNASGEAGKKKHKDEQTLDGLAATASAERADAGANRADGPATELLRSDSGGGLGMGVFLWAVLGVTALWAIATVVRRRQDGDGHPA